MSANGDIKDKALKFSVIITIYSNEKNTHTYRRAIRRIDVVVDDIWCKGTTYTAGVRYGDAERDCQ
jgi:hypothetical protein